MTRKYSCVTARGVPTAVWPVPGEGEGVFAVLSRGAPESWLRRGGTPVLTGGGGGIQFQSWLRGTPVLSCQRVPHPVLAKGTLPEKDLAPMTWEKTRAWGTRPTPCERTHTCENITFPHSSDAGGSNSLKGWWGLVVIVKFQSVTFSSYDYRIPSHALNQTFWREVEIRIGNNGNIRVFYFAPDSFN